MDTVDWYHLGIALTTIFKTSKTDFSRFVKFMNSMSNTGVQKKRFTDKSKTAVATSDKCPCCKYETENKMHLFRCSHEEIQKSHHIIDRNIIHITKKNKDSTRHVAHATRRNGHLPWPQL